MGQKHQGFDEQIAIPEGFLAAQQAFQALAFAVGENERVLNGLSAALMVPGPILSVPPQVPGVAFDLEQENPLRARDQHIDLVDRAVVRDELEIRPCPVVVLAWEPLVNEIQGLVFHCFSEDAMGSRTEIWTADAPKCSKASTFKEIQRSDSTAKLEFNRFGRPPQSQEPGGVEKLGEEEDVRVL